MSAMTKPLLEASGVTATRGGRAVLRGADLSVEAGGVLRTGDRAELI